MKTETFTFILQVINFLCVLWWIASGFRYLRTLESRLDLHIDMINMLYRRVAKLETYAAMKGITEFDSDDSEVIE